MTRHPARSPQRTGPYLKGVDPRYSQLNSIRVQSAKGRVFQIDGHSLTIFSLAGGANGHFGFESQLGFQVQGVATKGGRKKQEDSIYAAEVKGPHINLLVFAVADGLGGRTRGNLASSTAIQAVHATLVSMIKNPSSLTLSADTLFLGAEFALCFQTQQAHCQGSDTTLSVGMLTPSAGHLATAGDSACIRFGASGEASQITSMDLSWRDHLNIMDKTLSSKDPTSYFLNPLDEGAVFCIGTDGLLDIFMETQHYKASLSQSLSPQTPSRDLLSGISLFVGESRRAGEKNAKAGGQYLARCIERLQVLPPFGRRWDNASGILIHKTSRKPSDTLPITTLAASTKKARALWGVR